MDQPNIPQKSPIMTDVEPGIYFWCSCGKSGNQPFCDGAHKGTGFAPVMEKVTEAKKVYWCGCKHSANAPFCDGAHKNL